MRLVFVALWELPDWLPKCDRHIEQIAKGSGGRQTRENITSLLVSGRWQLILVLDGDKIMCAAVAQRLVWPTGLVELEFIGLVGKHVDKWIHLDAELKAKAKEMGYDVIRPIAPPGWSRFLKGRGWKMTHVILEYVL